MTDIHFRVAAPAVLLLVASVGCGGGGGGYNPPTTPTSQPSGPAPSAADVSIAIVREAGAQSFNPNPSTVRVGQTVAWRNSDSIMHHVVEDGADSGSGDDGYGYGNGGSMTGFDGGAEGPGAVSSMLNARTAGTMRYHCAIHPGMVGTLTVIP